MELEFR